MGRLDKRRERNAALGRVLGWCVPVLIAGAVAAAVAIGSVHRRSTDGSPATRRIPETGALFRFPQEDRSSSRASAVAAIALTASDGTGLTLASFDARAVIEGPLSFTEVHLGFDNPEDRTLEGTFRITLPQGAAISRFAMRQGDKWQEGEVVEKEAARRAYEDFLHRRQDPALLEQAAGNEFSARVFPIPAHARKELILSYSQELGPESPYTVSLRGLPVVKKLDAVVSHGGDDAPLLGQIHLENAAPDRDLVVPASKLALGDGLRSGEAVVIRVSPASQAGQDPLGAALFLVDTSASRALGFDTEIAMVAGVIGALPPEAPVLVAAFDQGIDTIYAGKASGFAEVGPARLHERQALGASDLVAAIDWARSHARGAKASRVVIVTDGVATVGATEAAALRASVASLAGASVERLDALALGGIRDDALLRQLTSAGLPRDGVVIDGARGVEAASRRLGLATRKVNVKVEGARWQWPEDLAGMQPGDEALVYAEVPEGTSPRVRIGDAEVLNPKLGTAYRPLLDRSLAQAKIAQLLTRPTPGETQARAEIVRISTTQRVLSPFTSLLVLESEADYARFKIDRKALANVLTVDGTRLAWLKRGEEIVLGPDTPTGAPPSDGIVLTPPSAVPPSDTRPAAPGQSRAAEVAPRAAARAAKAEEARAADNAAPPPAPAARAPEPPARAAAAAPAAFAAPSPMPADNPKPKGHSLAPSAPRLDVPSLGLSGVGEGGGGRGDGIGLGGVGAGRRRGVGPGEGFGPGHGRAVEAPRQQKSAFGPYEGPLATVMEALAKGDRNNALAKGIAAWRSSPGDVMALVGLGEAFEARGETRSAARAYGSLVDLYSSRADLRRMAGERLERLGLPYALDLAADTYAKAVAQRPDHPAGHRLLAYAHLRAGNPEAAFAAIEAGAKATYAPGRFPGVDRILREDVGLIGAAWIKAEPSRREEITLRVVAAGAALPSGPSLRFVLVWETDNNDVDFHIHDAKGGHAYYSQKTLASGGSLYADVTTGYGPECFTVGLPAKLRAGPYRLQAHYYSRGPMGYGMGKLEILDHDGEGGLTFEERPFVIMQDHAFVELGSYPANGSNAPKTN